MIEKILKNASPEGEESIEVYDEDPFNDFDAYKKRCLDYKADILTGGLIVEYAGTKDAYDINILKYTSGKLKVFLWETGDVEETTPSSYVQSLMENEDSGVWYKVAETKADYETLINKIFDYMQKRL